MHAWCILHTPELSCFNYRCFPTVSLKPAFCKVRIGKVEARPPFYLLAWCLLGFPWTPSASLSVGESSKWGDEIVMAARKRESDSRWCYIPSFKDCATYHPSNAKAQVETSRWCFSGKKSTFHLWLWILCFGMKEWIFWRQLVFLNALSLTGSK